ncbi:MAG TPA: hypothetical protein VK400_14170 [Pyrinomonadaceae bacterium]|nr:hypothetical protein [Pyrinomonadaceae bacterium]
MLIDEFMPVYDFDEKHETIVRASAEKVYAALDSFDFNESAVIRGLFRLRGLAAKESCAEAKDFALRDMTKFGFVILGEKPNREILLGLVGKFWTLTGNLQNVEAGEFSAFDKEGYAKAAWNFTLSGGGETETRLKTETRVQCTGAASRESFRFYWMFIKPFSGWIRQEMLRLVKQKAEADS